MNWFEKFSASIHGDAVSVDLVGAGTATAERAMSHYRYQHQAKVREAVEETFPVSVKLLGNEWEFWWKQFWASAPASPRSLDFFGEQFLRFVQATSAPARLKDLLAFEWALEIFPWSHTGAGPVSLVGLSEDSRVELAAHELVRLSTPASRSYDEEQWQSGEGEIVLLWMKESRVHYRAMQEWELEVLQALHQGVGLALGPAPEDPTAVSALFQWLGESQLIRAIHNV